MERVTCPSYQCYTTIKFVDRNVHRYSLIFKCRQMRGNVYFDDGRRMCEENCPFMVVRNVNKVGSVQNG